MANHNLGMIVVCLSLMALGITLAIQFHAYYIHPLDKAREVLSKTQATSNPQTILNDLSAVKGLLPASGNPVLISPTDETDFGHMQKDLATMRETLDNIEYIPTSSADFQTGMLNVHAGATTIVFDILDAMRNVNLPFELANSVWLLGVTGLVQYAGTRKR